MITTIDKSTKRKYYFLVLLLFFSSSSLFLYLSYSYYSGEKLRNEEVYKETQLKAADLATSIDAYMTSQVARLISLSIELSASTNKDATENAIKKFLNNQTFFHAVSIAYLPFLYQKNIKLHATHYSIYNNKLQEKYIPTYYDYTQKNWFIEPLQKRDIYFSLPEYDPISKKTVFRISKHFYKKNALEPEAIIVGDVFVESFDRFTGLIGSEDSQIIIFNKNGTLLAHPVAQYAIESKSLIDLALSTGILEFKILSEQVKNQNKGIISLFSQRTGQSFWAAYTPLKMAGYYVCFILPTKDLNILAGYLHIYIQLALSLALVIFMFFVLIALYFDFTKIWVWFLVVLFSILCFSLMSLIWYLDYTSRKIEHRDKQEIVHTREFLDTFLKINQKLRNVANEKEIKTGIYIESILINEKSEVVMKGVVWQKLDKNISKSHEPGLNLFGSNATISYTPAYQSVENDTLTKGWFFASKSNFSGYIKYPLDQHLITLNFLPKNYMNPVVFVPDFDSFNSTEKVSESVINKNLKILGWRIISGYFAYSLTKFSTQMGLEKFEKKENFPILQFTILLRRQFLYPLFAGFISIIVCLIILFIILLTTAKDTVLTRVISILSSLFFAAILAHQRMKNVLPEVNEINYMEIFYFLVFVVITLVTLDIVLYVKGNNIPFIHKRDNWPAIILYWPTILFAFLIITLAVFY